MVRTPVVVSSLPNVIFFEKYVPTRVVGFASTRSIHGQHRREADNIVPPECSPDFGQVGFVEKVSVTRRLQIDTANLDIDRVFLRGDQQIGAVGAQLPADLVADVGRHRNHGGSHRYTQA